MIWDCMSRRGKGALWIMPKNTTITSKVYLDVLKKKLEPMMNNLECEIFQQDGAPVHQCTLPELSKTGFLKKNNRSPGLAR